MSEEEQGEKAESIKLDMNNLIRERWAPVRELGRGNFGKVYHVINIEDGREGAMKTEKVDGESLLKIEVEIMNEMKGQLAAVQILDEGATPDFRFLIMTLCGLDLTRISQLLNNKFSDSTILRLSIRILHAIKTLHETGYLHRDLKPCNLALDYHKDSHVIYLLDFGMARKFARQGPDNQWWIRARRSQCPFRGTLRYCSLNMHKRIDLGRVDDLWSWIYMIIEMRCELPWANTTHPDKVEIQKTELINATVHKDPLIKTYWPIIEHLNGLTYPDRPDYSMIFNTIYNKVKEIGANMMDPMDFDAVRPQDSAEHAAVIKKYNVTCGSREKCRDLKKETDELAEFFVPKPNDLPGGTKYVISKNRNFYYRHEEKLAKGGKLDPKLDLSEAPKERNSLPSNKKSLTSLRGTNGFNVPTAQSVEKEKEKEKEKTKSSKTKNKIMISSKAGASIARKKNI